MLENILSVEDYFSSILTIPSHKALSQASISSKDQKPPSTKISVIVKPWQVRRNQRKTWHEHEMK